MIRRRSSGRPLLSDSAPTTRNCQVRWYRWYLQVLQRFLFRYRRRVSGPSVAARWSLFALPYVGSLLLLTRNLSQSLSVAPSPPPPFHVATPCTRPCCPITKASSAFDHTFATFALLPNNLLGIPRRRQENALQRAPRGRLVLAPTSASISSLVPISLFPSAGRRARLELLLKKASLVK